MPKSASTLPDEFLTVAQVAEILHRTPKTVRRWIKNGELPAYRIGRNFIIDPAELLNAIKKNKT